MTSPTPRLDVTVLRPHGPMDGALFKEACRLRLPPDRAWHTVATTDDSVVAARDADVHSALVMDLDHSRRNAAGPGRDHEMYHLDDLDGLRDDGLNGRDHPGFVD